MSYLEMFVLAVIQGIAEFLPISSSGHLVLVGTLLGGHKETATVEIVLHAGTLGSILFVYWQRILNLLSADRRVIPLLVVGTIPAGVAGLLIKSRVEWLLTHPLLAACMLLITGGLLITLRFVPEGQGEYRKMHWWQALVIGAFQAVALLPGISRSGSTIVGARLLGLNKDEAVTFSFLLAIPAILGATVLTAKDLIEEPSQGGDLQLLLFGAVVAFIVGVVALSWLIRWARDGRLYWFAWWCFPVGLLGILLYLAGYLNGDA
jgi:undecaprenyl-diphosphatase